jgi:hypothetical protein
MLVTYHGTTDLATVRFPRTFPGFFWLFDKEHLLGLERVYVEWHLLKLLFGRGGKPIIAA